VREKIKAGRLDCLAVNNIPHVPIEEKCYLLAHTFAEVMLPLIFERVGGLAVVVEDIEVGGLLNWDLDIVPLFLELRVPTVRSNKPESQKVGDAQQRDAGNHKDQKSPLGLPNRAHAHQQALSLHTRLGLVIERVA